MSETMNLKTLAHVVNPFSVPGAGEHAKAQAVTLATLKNARDAAANDVRVELFACTYPEDQSLIPAGFHATRCLDRSVLDVSAIAATKPRRLPLLKDILDRLREQSAAEYFVYSNIDIALVPGFYSRVAAFLSAGYDGFAINRRTIGRDHLEVEDIPRMIAAAERGEKHPGFDCFVFRREAYGQYRLGTACVGGNWVGRVLLSNVMAFCEKFRVFDDECLTFHLGDDRPWLQQENEPYNLHNARQLCATLQHLLALEKSRRKPELKAFFTDVLSTQKGVGDAAADADRLARNSPRLRLPDRPERVYHTEFRPSAAWEGYSRQRLRQDPIFVVGYPRSGTTLVQALVATQGGIRTLPETHFFGDVRWKITVNDNGAIAPGCLDTVLGEIRRRISFSLNAEEHLRRLAQGSGVSVKMLFEILVIDHLIVQTDLAGLETVRWLEKTPQHELYLDVIRRFYPAAKFLHVVRHPERAILSRRRNFAFGNEASWTIERHARNWLECAEAAERFAADHPGSLLTVRLEDVTRDPRGETGRICRFLGIPFAAGKLQRRREIAKTLYYPWETWKSRAAEDVSAAERKENGALSPQEREVLLQMLGPRLAAYGYSAAADAPPRRRAGPRLAAARQGLRKAKKLLRRVFAPPGPAGRSRSRSQPAQPGAPGKVNLADQLKLFYGPHRSGWSYAVRSLGDLHNPAGVRLDAFIERTFAWRSHEAKSHEQPWLGFIHIPPAVPDWFQGHQANEAIFRSAAWGRSAPHCLGLFTLSLYHRRALEKVLEIPVNNLLFPTETPEVKWSWEKFSANREKKIIQVGWWLRRIHSIFQLPAGDYRKIFLKVDYFNWDDLIRKERELLIREGTFRDEMYDSARTVTYLPGGKYDRLLAENLVFIHLYDSSANNTIIECIVRNTPLLVNPLESVREYLGDEYPFYFSTLEEAAQKAADLDLVWRTHQYLLHHPIKEKLTGAHFRKSFVESEIYRRL